VTRTALQFTFVVLLLTGTTSCISDEAVQAFATAGKQASDFFPRVAGISFNACVEQHVYQQIANNSSRILVDRAAAEGACITNAQARDRLIKEYSVMFDYLALLGRATGQDNTAYDESVKNVATSISSLAGYEQEQGAAVSGLAGVIADVYLRGRRAKSVRDAIASANPHIQVLCSAFRNDIQRFIVLTLQNQERELKALYGDSAVSGPLRVLIARQFDSDLIILNTNRELADRYRTVLEAIAGGHAELNNRRDTLRNRESFQAVFQYVATVQKQVNAIRDLIGK